jgi:hypothetical protein
MGKEWEYQNRFDKQGRGEEEGDSKEEKID